MAALAYRNPIRTCHKICSDSDNSNVTFKKGGVIMAEQGNQPWRSFQSRSVQIAIWQSLQMGKDNREYVRHSLKIQKQYYDENEEKWLDSDYLFPADLADVVLLCQKAKEVISLRETTNRTSKVETAEEPEATEEEPDNIPV